MKIALVGCYPPPYGGISVHIKRIKNFLDKKSIKNVVFNNTVEDKKNNIVKYKIRIILIKLFLEDYSIIHFHSVDKRIRIFIPIYKLFGKKVILTIHGESLMDQILESNFFVKNLILNSLNKMDKIICVNPKTVKELQTLKINSDILVNIPPYINPIETIYDYKYIPKNVKDFINNQNSFLITANGLIKFYNNEDLYGIDLLIDLMNKLIIANYSVKMIIALLGVKEQNNEEQQYYLKLKTKIKNYRLEDKIFIYEVENTEFYPILKKSDLFLRPTNTDGYGMSIAESIYFNVPGIASDVCERPKGTILFKNRNFKDLYNKVVDVMENYDYYKEKIRKLEVRDNSEKIINVYEELLKDEFKNKR